MAAHDGDMIRALKADRRLRYALTARVQKNMASRLALCFVTLQAKGNRQLTSEDTEQRWVF